MKKQLLHITMTAMLTAFFITGTAEAMDWPSRDAVMIRNFGWNDAGKPVLGMVFSGGTEVLAVETGEMIFSRGRNDTASRLPSPLGAWTALDHGDGLISIYSRHGSESPQSNRIERQSPITSSGISGWSGTAGFYFMLYDRRERSWINPAMIINPAQDTRPPQILSVVLRNERGLVVNNDQMRNLSQGNYTVSVTTTDLILRPRDNYLAPHRIVCSINGAEIGSLNFEAFSSRDGVLMVSRNGLVPARRIYSSYPAFEAAEVYLSRGQANLEVIVQNVAGNSRSSLIRMIVN
ncbi:MAG: hypothetical protein FWG99_08710 [Treponema sp.]|nr:hypothetical protein [Treponema sp.]